MHFRYGSRLSLGLHYFRERKALARQVRRGTPWRNPGAGPDARLGGNQGVELGVTKAEPDKLLLALEP